jgi:hypothetical protein
MSVEIEPARGSITAKVTVPFGDSHRPVLPERSLGQSLRAT